MKCFAAVVEKQGVAERKEGQLDKGSQTAPPQGPRRVHRWKKPIY